MSMSKPIEIHFTIRDALQSNHGMNVPADDVVASMPNVADYGVASVQTSGGTAWDLPIKKGRDPFEFNSKILDHCSDVQTTALGRGNALFAYDAQPYDVIRAQMQFHAEHGLNVVQNFNAMNDLEQMEGPIRAIKELQADGYDIHGWGTICVQENPNTQENEDALIAQHVDMAEQLLEMGHEGIYVKNANGVLRPEFTGKLVGALRERLGEDVPINIHVHNTYGQAIGNYLAAIKAGATGVDVLPDALAGGTAQASLSMLEHAMKYSGDPEIEARLPQGINYDAIEADHEAQILMRAANSQTELKYDRDNLSKAEAAGSAGGAISAIKGVHGLVENIGRKLGTDDWDTIRNAIYAQKEQNRAAFGYATNVTPVELMQDLQAANDVYTGQSFGQLAPTSVKYLLGHMGEVSPDADPALIERAKEAAPKMGIPLEPVKFDDMEPGLPKANERVKGLERRENAPDLSISEQTLIVATAGENGVNLVTGKQQEQARNVIESRRLEGVSPLIADVAYKAVEITKLRDGFYKGVNEPGILADQMQDKLEETVALLEERLHEMGRDRGIASQANREMRIFARALGAQTDMIPDLDLNSFEPVPKVKRVKSFEEMTLAQQAQGAEPVSVEDAAAAVVDNDAFEAPKGYTNGADPSADDRPTMH